MISSCVAVITLVLATAAGAVQQRGSVVVRDGELYASLVVQSGEETLDSTIAATLQESIRELIHKRLRQRRWSEIEDGAARGELVFLASTVDELPEALRKRFEADRIAHDGFLIKTVHGAAPSPVLAMVGGSPRGVYNAAVYLRDFIVDPATPDDWTLPDLHILRTPLFRRRVAAAQMNWGDHALRSVEHWRWTVDQISRWGWTHWAPMISGVYPSTRFPEQEMFPDAAMSGEGLRDCIEHAHEHGLGVIGFAGLFLWAGTDLILNERVKDAPSIRATGRRGGMCVSDDKAQELMLDYAMDILEYSRVWMGSGSSRGTKAATGPSRTTPSRSMARRLPTLR